MLQETHVSGVEVEANIPNSWIKGFTAFSSAFHNNKKNTGGVATLISDKFLEKYDSASCVEIKKGRISTVTLAKGDTRVAVTNVHLDAKGVTKDVRDEFSLMENFLEASNFNIIGGVFNFVTKNSDAFNHKDRKNDAERKKANNVLAQVQRDFNSNKSITEIAQPETTFSHRGCGHRARLDRIYAPSSPTIDAVLNKSAKVDLKSTLIHSDKGSYYVSDHRPVTATIRVSELAKGRDRIPVWVTKLSDFTKEASFLFRERSTENLPARDKLRYLKMCFKQAAKNILEEGRRKATKEEGIADVYTQILAETLENNPDFARIAALDRILAPKDKTFITRDRRDIQKIINFLDNRELEGEIKDEDTRDFTDSQKYDPSADFNLLRALKNTNVTNNSSIGHIISEEGQFGTPSQEVEWINKHWAGVAGKKTTVNPDRYSELIDKYIRLKGGKIKTPRNHWSVSKEDVEDSILEYSESSPGPDGIPAQAFKSTIALSAPIIYELYHDFVQGKSMENPGEFNIAALALLGKKPDLEADISGNSYRSGSTRPISISNFDYRFVTSLFRTKLNSLIESYVDQAQQGAMANRDGATNVSKFLGWYYSPDRKNTDHAALLVDYAAAFTSIDHEWLLFFLGRIGIDNSFKRVFRFFLSDIRHEITWKGEKYISFEVKGGVKQGCPLSPLLFVLTMDFVVTLLGDANKGPVGAFADDIAIGLEDEEGVRSTHAILRAFSALSAMEVNVSKTECISCNKGSDAIFDFCKSMEGWDNLKKARLVSTWVLNLDSLLHSKKSGKMQSLKPSAGSTHGVTRDLRSPPVLLLPTHLSQQSCHI